MSRYGVAPIFVGRFGEVDLKEVMYYLYLPVAMPHSDLRLPLNVEACRPLVEAAMANASAALDVRGCYVYLSARKGWASPDNPLNRPGWHCDGFGTDDLNYVWWSGPGTRFLVGDIGEVPADHKTSLKHFEIMADNPNTTFAEAPYRTSGRRCIEQGLAHCLYGLDPYVVHATPVIAAPGCMRQYVKISISPHKYNLENNSHNFLFDYSWPLHDREAVRNDTFKAQRDFA